MAEQLGWDPPTTKRGRPRLALRRAVEASIEAAAWIGPEDQALCQVAVTAATRLDKTDEDAAWFKQVSELVRTLEHLGLTPKVRKAMTGATDDPVDAFLASLGAGPVRDQP